jgi:1,2-diacylglycerol 3-alpha-glucosyltransferase/glucuronosyltransferase
MRLLIVSDAWLPQINGVVRTLTHVKAEIERLGHEVHVISPDLFTTFPCPGYAEIRLSLAPGRRLTRLVDQLAPEAIHIATEGPLGLAARCYCLRRDRPFTTSFHTRFPEYVAARLGLPPALGYVMLRRFHRPSSAVMTATDTLRGELARRGFGNLRAKSRGVDTDQFRPGPKDLYDLPRPIFINVGRVAVEKNIPAFLDLDLPGSKVVVGDGPQLPALRRDYPNAHYVGAKTGVDLARHYAAADVFVFPSRTDTFGLVLLEALASGLPVAAYPVPGPLDVIGDTGTGCLSEDLADAAMRALTIPSERCRAEALRHSWKACAEQFLGNLRAIA